MKYLLALLLAVSASSLQAQTVCDQECYADMTARILDLEKLLSEQEKPPSLWERLSERSDSNKALRATIAQLQRDKEDLVFIVEKKQREVAELEVALEAATATGGDSSCVDPTHTILMEAWEELRADNEQLRLNVILQQSLLLEALGQCFAGGI